MLYFFPDIYSFLGGSTKSLDQDAGYESKSSSNTSTDRKDQEVGGKNYSSFSSYLAMRTKSPARPPSTIKGGSSTLQSTSSTSSLTSSSSNATKEPTRNGILHHHLSRADEEKLDEPQHKQQSRYSSGSSSSNSTIGDSTSTSRSLRSSLSTIGEGSRVGSSSGSEARPPRAPVRIKERSLSAKLPDVKESSAETKPKTILSLKVRPFVRYLNFFLLAEQ